MHKHDYIKIPGFIFRWFSVTCVFSLFVSCENSDNKSDYEVHSIQPDDDFEVVYWQNPNASNEPDNNEIKELIKIWNWNESIAVPERSSITNPKFITKYLFNSWSSSPDESPLFSFSPEYFTVQNEGNYMYTIHNDSLRIFTAYDWPGDGHQRGIIKKLTRDSLHIAFTEGGLSKFVAVGKE